MKLVGLFLVLEGCAVLGKAGRLHSARVLFDIMGLPIPQKWQVNAGVPTKEGIKRPWSGHTATVTVRLNVLERG